MVHVESLNQEVLKVIELKEKQETLKHQKQALIQATDVAYPVQDTVNVTIYSVESKIKLE